MRHSMLLTGKNQIIKEELLAHFTVDFECLTCSAGSEDIKNHFKHFVPDVLVCCLSEEAEESSIPAILAVEETLKKNDVVVVVVGPKKDCDYFLSCAPKLARFVFEKPLNTDLISDCLNKFLEKKDTDNLLNQINAFCARKSVMVIDDDPFMRKLMTGYLQEEYDVVTASGGKEAIRQLEEKPADLILLDYEMPEESGPEVLEQLHKNDATRDIPVIFLTSIMHKEMIQKALLLKPQGYLLKPVNRDMLLEAIKNLLR